MKNNVLKSFLFIFILLILVGGLTWVFFPKDNIKRFGISNVYNYDILSEEDDIIDVLVLGDSLVYSSYSPMEVWNSYGITSYDCAEPAQIIQDAYKYLQVAIEKEHPKIVIMEPNVMFRDAKKRKLKNVIATEAPKWVPIVKYHDKWKNYLFGDGDIVTNVNKGYTYISKTKPSKPMKYMAKTSIHEKIPDGNLDYLEKIIKLCNDYGAKLIFMSFPTQTSWNYRKHNSSLEVSEKYGIDFIDLNMKNLGIDWINDTKDHGAHLNYTGSKKVSLYVGNYLKESGLLLDHRNDKKYRLWDKAYTVYESNLTKY